MRMNWVDTNRLKYAFGFALYFIGIFVAVMIALELSILQIPFTINGFQVKMIGFPWLTEQVADSTGLWRMPSYSQQFPNVYFFNYGEALIVSIVLFIIGKKLRQYSENVYLKNQSSFLSKAGFISTIISMFVLLYFWVRMTVLWNTYVFGNTVYYPATTPPPTTQWLQQFGLSLSIHLRPYTGGLPLRVNTSTIPLSIGLIFDAPLYITALFLFISIITWKYFGQVQKKVGA